MLTQPSSSNVADAAHFFPLTFAASGETVSLVAIRSGDRLRKRLGELGLTTGMRVRVVQGDSGGPVILAVRNDSRLAIGRGMAQNIFVTPTGGNSL